MDDGRSACQRRGCDYPAGFDSRGSPGIFLTVNLAGIRAVEDPALERCFKAASKASSAQSDQRNVHPCRIGSLREPLFPPDHPVSGIPIPSPHRFETLCKGVDNLSIIINALSGVCAREE